jgi:hypothetical protein
MALREDDPSGEGKMLLYSNKASTSGDRCTKVICHLHMRTFCSCTSRFETLCSPCAATRELWRGRPSVMDDS